MQPLLSPFFFAVILFLGMYGMLEVGRWVAVRFGETEAERASLASIEAAVFALFGLLIAFTFSGAASRFQEKRIQIAEEANVIESAYMRIDLVAADAQPRLREEFREYLDARLEIYRRLPDMKAAHFAIERSKQLELAIWKDAIAATRISYNDPAGSRLLLPAVMDVIHMHRTRMTALQNHPPGLVYVLLLLLGLLCSLLAGFRMATGPRRNWLHMVIFPLVTAAVVYLTIDIEYPRVGLIRLEHADQMLEEVRARMD
jgi:ABC-type multidrug transport system fused ATPase/permease subunit